MMKPDDSPLITTTTTHTVISYAEIPANKLGNSLVAMATLAHVFTQEKFLTQCSHKLLSVCR